jgi:hypothetical protein
MSRCPARDPTPSRAPPHQSGHPWATPATIAALAAMPRAPRSRRPCSSSGTRRASRAARCGVPLWRASKWTATAVPSRSERQKRIPKIAPPTSRPLRCAACTTHPSAFAAGLAAQLRAADVVHLAHPTGAIPGCDRRHGQRARSNRDRGEETKTLSSAGRSYAAIGIAGKCRRCSPAAMSRGPRSPARSARSRPSPASSSSTNSAARWWW